MGRITFVSVSAAETVYKQDYFSWMCERDGSCLAYLRCLSPGGVLLKFTVMDGKIRPKITAVTQRRDTAAERERKRWFILN